MTTITKLSQLDLNKSYTYADYLMWQLLPGDMAASTCFPELRFSTETLFD